MTPRMLLIAYFVTRVVAVQGASFSTDDDRSFSRATRASAIIFAGLLGAAINVLRNTAPAPRAHRAFLREFLVDWVFVALMWSSALACLLLATVFDEDHAASWITIMPSAGLLALAAAFAVPADSSHTMSSFSLSQLFTFMPMRRLTTTGTKVWIPEAVVANVTFVASLGLAVSVGAVQIAFGDVVTGSLSVVGVVSALLGAHPRYDIVSPNLGGPAHAAVYGSPTIGDRTSAYFFGGGFLHKTNLRGAAWKNRDVWRREYARVRAIASTLKDEHNHADPVAVLRDFLKSYVPVAMEMAETEAHGKECPKTEAEWREALLALARAEAEAYNSDVQASRKFTPLQNLWYVLAAMERVLYRQGPRYSKDFDPRHGYDKYVYNLARRLSTHFENWPWYHANSSANEHVPPGMHRMPVRRRDNEHRDYVLNGESVWSIASLTTIPSPYNVSVPKTQLEPVPTTPRSPDSVASRGFGTPSQPGSPAAGARPDQVVLHVSPDRSASRSPSVASPAADETAAHLRVSGAHMQQSRNVAPLANTLLARGDAPVLARTVGRAIHGALGSQPPTSQQVLAEPDADVGLSLNHEGHAARSHYRTQAPLGFGEPRLPDRALSLQQPTTPPGMIVRPQVPPIRARQRRGSLSENSSPILAEALRLELLRAQSGESPSRGPSPAPSLSVASQVSQDDQAQPDDDSASAGSGQYLAPQQQGGPYGARLSGTARYLRVARNQLHATSMQGRPQSSSPGAFTISVSAPSSARSGPQPAPVRPQASEDMNMDTLLCMHNAMTGWLDENCRKYGISERGFNGCLREARGICSSWPVIMAAVVEFFWTLEGNTGGRFDPSEKKRIDNALLEQKRCRRSLLLAVAVLQLGASGYTAAVEAFKDL